MYLRQSTATVVALGPFVDKADGVTELTALAAPTGRIAKGGTAADFTPASWAHDAHGTYLVGLGAAHVDTPGRLHIAFADAAIHLPVWRTFVVLAPAAYDALVGDAPFHAWADAEQQQMRAALGLDGDAADTTGTGVLDAVARRVEALVARPFVHTTLAAGSQDISRYRGDSHPIAFDLGRDITGAALAFTVKRRAKDPQSAAVIAKTSADPADIELVDAAAGQFHIHLAAADTADLIPCGRPTLFVYDVQMTLDGAVETVAAGDLLLLPDVTTD